MFVLNPDPYSLPCYRIGPFQTRDLAYNANLGNSDSIDEYFKKRFSNKDFIYTENGRKAINLALKYYNLKKTDVVTILTTTSNLYISGCVTREIEKICKWSRRILPETKVLLVNHEFGYPYKNLRELKKFNLPIIEDCANSFFSQDQDQDIGKIGDFVVYSFPKMFPLQIGGLLLSNLSIPLNNKYQPEKTRLRYIKNVLSHYISDKEKIISKRISNYLFLSDNFKSLGLTERFELEKNIVPGVFMFRKNKLDLNLPDLKSYYYSHGVQCSVFYGEEAFFLPCHQNLVKEDILYFYEIMKSFINRIS